MYAEIIMSYNSIQMVLNQPMFCSASWRLMGRHGSSAAWDLEKRTPQIDIMEALSRAKLSLHLIQCIVLP